MSDGAALVGRRAELDRLGAALASTRAGGGRAVSVAGEPGVGKTTLLRAFAASASAAGTTVLWGTCFDGAAQPAYGPWTMALAPLGLDVGAPIAGLSPPEARLRRGTAVHDALGAAGPVVVVLDDLHWAGTETLDILGHVAARVGPAPVLLVAAYRDPDPALATGTPLSALLADLARLSGYAHVSVAGLDVDDVAAYLCETVGDAVPGAIVRAVREHTGGNPFYLREVVTALVDEGKLVHRDGRWSSDFSVAELGIPVTVRHAVRGRIARLGAGAQALLQAASVFSGDLALGPVSQVAGLGEAAALDALDEALATGFLQLSGAGAPAAPYAFAHAIVRDALAGALSPDRAARLHRHAAVALEATRPQEHAAIAEQYWLSRTVAGAEAGVAHCLAAADAATGEHASRRSARLLRLALDLVPGDRAVLSRLALAQAADLDASAAATTLLAIEGAGREEAADLIARVAEALREGTPASAWEPLVRQGLALVGDDRGAAWARLVTLVDPVETVGTGTLRAGRWLGYPEEAVGALRATGREDDAARAIDPFRPRSEDDTRELLARSATWTAVRPRMRALDLAGRDLSLRQGRPADAIECYRQLLELGERVGSTPAQAEAHAQLALCLALTGDLAQAEGHLATSAGLVADLWPGHRLHLLGTVSSSSVVTYLKGEGDSLRLASRFAQWTASPAAAVAPFSNVFAALVALHHALAGDREAARRGLVDLVDLLDAMQPADHAVAGSLWFAAAAAGELGDADAAEGLAGLADRHLAGGGPPGPASVEHAAGRLAALLGRGTDAARHLDMARARAAAAGSRGVLALVELDLAVLAGDPALVEACRHRFEQLGMTGWAARSTPAAAPSPARPAGLTAREVEVLALLAGGATSQEIAGALVLSLATVNRHIANIYVKIGARNRAEATGFAISHGIA